MNELPTYTLRSMPELVPDRRRMLTVAASEVEARRLCSQRDQDTKVLPDQAKLRKDIAFPNAKCLGPLVSPRSVNKKEVKRRASAQHARCGVVREVQAINCCRCRSSVHDC